VEIVESAAACRTLLDGARSAGSCVGLVPTMGALHAGHLSLMARARSECDTVVASIFVNPLQFGDPDDIARYPRTLESDLRACDEAGVDVVFAPTVAEMYPTWPEPPAATVSVRGVSEEWEGASRPGHFDGVATVVAKLFAIAGPCRAYFGLKDFQQLAVVRAMATELSLPVELVGCPIVREDDGLALSSRNVRLSVGERAAATVLSRALAAGRAAVAAGERSGAELARTMRRVVAAEAAEAAEAAVQLDYAVAVDGSTLAAVDTITDPAGVRLLIAAQVGPVRLIDNSAAFDDADDVAASPLSTRPSHGVPPHSVLAPAARPAPTPPPARPAPARPAPDAAPVDRQLERTV
jgi:pantoate--beta-alanine ligase